MCHGRAKKKSNKRPSFPLFHHKTWNNAKTPNWSNTTSRIQFHDIFSPPTSVCLLDQKSFAFVPRVRFVLRHFSISHESAFFGRVLKSFWACFSQFFFCYIQMGGNSDSFGILGTFFFQWLWFEKRRSYKYAILLKGSVKFGTWISLIIIHPYNIQFKNIFCWNIFNTWMVFSIFYW